MVSLFEAGSNATNANSHTVVIFLGLEIRPVQPIAACSEWWMVWSWSEGKIMYEFASIFMLMCSSAFTS